MSRVDKIKDESLRERMQAVLDDHPGRIAPEDFTPDPERIALFEVVCAQRPAVSARDDVAALRWIALDAVAPEAIAFTSIRRAVARLRDGPAAPGTLSG